ncbi:hypothetical protein [Kitasatospora sp. NPDC051914]|uniref:hypothetical protein n=1 Tax=Kitasatospora sp. NPDC051914 TaxID=3154945 RepID=UPI003441027A
MGEIAVWWCVLTGLTVVLISTVSPVELLVAALAALGAAFAARAMCLASGTEWRGARRAGRAVIRLPRSVLRGCAALLSALARRDEGGARLHRVVLREGSDPGWAGAALAASPDTCVIDMPHGDDALVHTLGDRPGPMERLLVERLPADPGERR